jgi:VIT1/CCC1 family predicted Fe2+/Mn2+ transporter
VAALVLFAIGAYKAKVTTGGPLRHGFELAVIGTVTALVGWGIGELFHVSPAAP